MHNLRAMPLAAFGVLLCLAGSPTAQAQDAPAIPDFIKIEHEELHEELAKAIAAGGKTGDAAREVEAVLTPHFEKEEAYAMPPLGLLVPLSRGEIAPEMRSVLMMTDRLRADLPEMLKEHEGIHVALQRLAEAAKAENQLDAAAFAEHLAQHAEEEEQILYPAALLVGDYLRVKLEK